MADHKLNRDDQGIYEIPLAANTVKTIEIAPTSGAIQIITHAGDSPIYVKRGTTVAAREPGADMTIVGNYLQLGVPPHGQTTTLAIISATAANISIIRA
jgi:hypothetical protein